RMPEVIGEAIGELLDRAAGGVIDAIAVELAHGGVRGVKGKRDLGEVDEAAVFREAGADRVEGGHGRHGREREDVSDLAGRVDAGVGAAGAEDVHLVAYDAADGLFDGVLYGSLSGLSLPTLEGGAVVGEGELEVAHRETMIRIRVKSFEFAENPCR